MIDTRIRFLLHILRMNGHSGAGSVENRAHPDTSNTLCGTAYWYELFAKCMLANQKMPYFQDGSPKFKMAAKIYHNTPKPSTRSNQPFFFIGQMWLILCKTLIVTFFVKKSFSPLQKMGKIRGKRGNYHKIGKIT